MNRSQIPVRYAKALIANAKEQGILDSVRDDMEKFMGIIKSVPDLLQLLESPIIKPVKKLEVLSAIFSGKVQPLTLSFFKLAVDKNREEHLPGMARMYIDMYKEAKGIKIATLKTATAIDKGTREELISMIRKTFNTEIELHEENIPVIFKDCDVIVEAFDKAEMKQMIMETVFDKMPDKYLVCGSGLAGWGDNGSIGVEISGKVYIFGDGIKEVSQDYPPLAPRVGIVANMQANQVLEILLGKM